MPDDAPRSATLRLGGMQTAGGDVTVLPPPDDPTPTQIQVDDDGGITISKPAIRKGPREAGAFDENLAGDLSEGDGAVIAAEIIAGVKSDEMGRTEWMENYNKALELLGLKIENVSTVKAQKRNVTRITHPLLLEAVVKGQGAALGELLPASGPCKVTLRGDDTEGLDDLALAFEQDMNAYLTVGAREYYPDMDRGLFECFFSGNLFKKVYDHPLKRRPVSECIPTEDLIVSQDSVSLEDAARVTHRTRIPRSLLRRMQVFGDWLEFDMPGASPLGNTTEIAKAEIFGMTRVPMVPADQPPEIYEVVTDLDLAEYGLREKGAPSDFPLPVVATIDVAGSRLLALRRGWREGSQEFERRQRYVHYGMVPAFWFLCLGHAHLLGNHTMALTAAWRLICDAGLFANFPGGVKVKGVRMSTNEIAPGPGEWPDIDIVGMDDIRKALMPMPYKEASPVFIQFIQSVAKEAEGLAGTVELPTGEGVSNVPVGTMLALVEQATKLDAVVHKRLHAAMSRELQLLKECVAENPESILKVIPNPARRWMGKMEFDSIDLIPVSDPNIPSQVHRVMLATAMITVAAEAPQLYNQLKVHERAWKIIGVQDAQSLFNTAPPGPPPVDPAKMAAAQAQATKAQADMLSAQTKAQDSKRKAATEALEHGAKQAKAQTDQQTTVIEGQAKAQQAALQVQSDQAKLQAEIARAQAQEDAAQAKAQAVATQQAMLP